MNHWLSVLQFGLLRVKFVGGVRPPNDGTFGWLELNLSLGKVHHCFVAIGCHAVAVVVVVAGCCGLEVNDVRAERDDGAGIADAVCAGDRNSWRMCSPRCSRLLRNTMVVFDYAHHYFLSPHYFHYHCLQLVIRFPYFPCDVAAVMAAQKAKITEAEANNLNSSRMCD
jgi:hypothetical protein